MIAFICLIFPAVLAVWFYEILSKRSLGLKMWFYRFAFNAVFINFLIFLIKKFILKTAQVAMYSAANDMSPDVAVNYLILAIPLAALFAAFQVLFSKKAKLTVEEANK